MSPEFALNFMFKSFKSNFVTLKSLFLNAIRLIAQQWNVDLRGMASVYRKSLVTNAQNFDVLKICLNLFETSNQVLKFKN